MPACVYLLRSKETGMVYVGSTTNLDKRLKVHFEQLRNGRHHNINLQGIWDAWEDVYLHEVLPTSDECHAKLLETKLIGKYIGLGYCANIGLQAVGGDNLTQHPNRKEIVAKITQAIKARMATLTPEERIEKFGLSGERNGMFGRTHTDEVKEVLRQNLLGNTNCVGFKHTEETKARMSAAASLKVGEKNSFYGKSHSEDTRKKMSEQKYGKPTGAGFEVEVDGVVYPSYYLASRALGIPIVTIRWRAHSENPRFKGYRQQPKC